MSKTPNYDAKVKAILDATTPGERVCALTGEKWNMTEEEIGWYKKFNVPPSEYHPETRNYIMTCFWLSFSWWWNKHAKTGKRILTYVHPATGIRVLPDVEWANEDFTSVGRSVDYQRSFLDQFRELRLAVPLLANRNYKEPHNSITMFSHGDVNSYFAMFSQSKNSFFALNVHETEHSAQVALGTSLSHVYDAVDGHRLFRCSFVRSSYDCMDSSFLFDCRNCEQCFGAWNKRNKKYLWWNEQLSQAEWEQRRKSVDLSCRSTVQEQFAKFRQVVADEAVWPDNFNERAINSSGEYLQDVTNLKESFFCKDGVHDCYRVSFSYEESYESAFCASNINSNNCYYSVNSASSAQMRFCDGCQFSQHLEYCIQCFHCENCFGCVGLNRKNFCILNKQYTEDEYWQELDRIKSWMMEQGYYGEFFPASLGINPFSESGAAVYAGAPPEIGNVIGAPSFDAAEDGALGEPPANKDVHSTEEIPDCIDAADDFLAGVPFYDEEARRHFAFLKPEIDFYREHHLPLPTRHFMDRMNGMSREFSAARFFTSECQACRQSLFVAYNAAYPDRKIYCKSCYLQHLEKNG